MRLLFLTVIYPNRFEPTKGPFNQSLVEALAANHEVRVVAPIQWPVAWGLDRKTAAAVATPTGAHAVPVSHPLFYYPPKVLHPWYGQFLWLSVRGTVQRLLTSYRPEAVIGYWAYPDGEAALRTARRAGALAGLIVGGSDVLLHTRHAGRRRATLEVLRSVDAIFAVGSDLRRRVIEFGIPPAKVHDFRQGVDTEHFRPGDQRAARGRLGIAPDATLLLWVGRMVAVKGLEVLLDACRLLQKDGLRFRLALLGDGPLRQSLAAQVQASGLAANVLFAGPVAHHSLPDWYRAADLTVLSSWSEGIPNVLLESLACGTPFVATQVGSIPALAIDPERDVVLPGEARPLAQAIAYRLANPGDRRPIVRYRWRDTAASLVEVLESLRPEGRVRPVC